MLWQSLLPSPYSWKLDRQMRVHRIDPFLIQPLPLSMPALLEPLIPPDSHFLGPRLSLSI